MKNVQWLNRNSHQRMGIKSLMSEINIRNWLQMQFQSWLKGEINRMGRKYKIPPLKLLRKKAKRIKVSSCIAVILKVISGASTHCGERYFSSSSKLHFQLYWFLSRLWWSWWFIWCKFWWRSIEIIENYFMFWQRCQTYPFKEGSSSPSNFVPSEE